MNYNQPTEKQNITNNININDMDNNHNYIPKTRNSYKSLVDTCIDLTTMKNLSLENDRRGFIAELAMFANIMGLELLYFADILKTEYSLDGEEVESCLVDIYNQRKNEFGVLAAFAKSNLCHGYAPDSKNAPKIPSEIYNHLPELLIKCFEPITDDRQKDMFLLSALTVIGGCLENYSGLYAGNTTYPNLYNFIVAPAASGKGVISCAKKITEKLEEQINDQNRQANIEYKVAIKDFKKGDDKDQDVEPVKPPKKMLYVPGNSTTAAIVDSFIDSGEILIMFETEADSVASSKGQFNAGFSELLRCAFHHEPYGTNRVCNDGVKGINKPRLSIVLSGTANQVVNLINSAENGLFSRFLYYSFDEPIKFRDVSPNERTPDLGQFYEDQSKQFLTFFNWMNKRKTTFSFSNSQWEEFMLKYSTITDVLTASKGHLKDVNSVITRNGVITFRIAMILTAMRMFELGQDEGEFVCTDEDFAVALRISETIFTHSLIVLKTLPVTAPATVNTSMLSFIQLLPNAFSRMEAVIIGNKLNLSDRTCDGYLKQLCIDGKLTKTSPGKYQKK